MQSALADTKLLNALRRLALARCYSVRDAKIILEARGFYDPSVEFVWKFFKRVRAKAKREQRKRK